MLTWGTFRSTLQHAPQHDAGSHGHALPTALAHCPGLDLHLSMSVCLRCSAEVDAPTIDRFNAHQAALLAMRAAVEGLVHAGLPPDYLLIDGSTYVEGDGFMADTRTASADAA